MYVRWFLDMNVGQECEKELYFEHLCLEFLIFDKRVGHKCPDEGERYKNI